MSISFYAKRYGNNNELNAQDLKAATEESTARQAAKIKADSASSDLVIDFNASNNAEEAANDYFAQAQNRTAEAEASYRLTCSDYSLFQSKQENLSRQLAYNPNDKFLKNSFNNIQSKFSTASINKDVAWWRWYSAVGAQNRAIIVA